MLAREKVVKTAVSYIGTKEPKGDDQFIKWYNKKAGTSFAMTASWCCMFATYIFDKCKYTILCRPYASCTALMKAFKAAGQWEERGHMPLMGDLCLYDWDKSGDADHIGIVEKVDGKNIYVVEGNKNDAVGRRKIAYNDAMIRGFAIPKYPTGDVNGDGKANAADALLILKSVVGKFFMKKSQKENADVNLDGKVNAEDAQAILKSATKK